MKSYVRFVIWALILSFALVTQADARGAVSVQGYTRRDGTYVQPYMRSAPDGNPYNNYSFPGNINPYTGKVAPGNPDTYLRDYYQRNGGVPVSPVPVAPRSQPYA